ncbi:hypothetical protein JAAARDRAFT_311579 [Jaapia argillacea MUCL 33604]|uniref:Uncharacterized protein n=1 Tax=Jaapia argillacea MUCL 33604 TaxID=933084 RepID=A0A067PNQ3_9AGAM|nr:hypothetical protein JAAARDRAFT_311579 [Jaapia argillacea MUCL 33604]
MDYGTNATFTLDGQIPAPPIRPRVSQLPEMMRLTLRAICADPPSDPRKSEDRIQGYSGDEGEDGEGVGPLGSGGRTIAPLRPVRNPSHLAVPVRLSESYASESLPPPSPTTSTFTYRSRVGVRMRHRAGKSRDIDHDGRRYAVYNPFEEGHWSGPEGQARTDGEETKRRKSKALLRTFKWVVGWYLICGCCKK